MPATPAHLDIIRIALEAAGPRFEVALAGGNALRVYDITARHTSDVDLFCRREDQVKAAADAIADALEAAGYAVERAAGDSDLADIWPDLEGLSEMDVTPPGSDQPVPIQVAFFEYEARVPVPGVGLVLSRDDLCGWKGHAIIDRGEPRDYVDAAAFIDRGYTIEQLMKLARERDPSITSRDFAEAGTRLDKMSDRRLEQHLPDSRDAAWVREAFRGWPREP